MSLAIVHSRGVTGIHAPRVTIEVHLSNGLPAFHLVGLAETSVRESRDRVRSALVNSGFVFPAKRITVNLAPADLPKEGGRFDLAIAIGIIAASGQIDPQALEQVEMVGELALSGQIRGVSAILPFAAACHEAQRHAILPITNDREASVIRDLVRYPAQHLTAVFKHLAKIENIRQPEPYKPPTEPDTSADMADILGQHGAKRALEIAAAGSHNLIFCGPPGTGKTMLASRMPGILPPLTDREALEIAMIHSVGNAPRPSSIYRTRPFRQPHHTSSSVALVGGGATPLPGEVSYAHHGVLFLDELPEFERRVLDVLREPIEAGEIHLSRAAGRATYPARFQLLAAMNPSPTGSKDDQRCSTDVVLKYLNRISGPFLDRFDMQVDVPCLPSNVLSDRFQSKGDTSDIIRHRVVEARKRQLERAGVSNAHISPSDLFKHCNLSVELEHFLQQAMDRLALSLRAVHRVLKVARTIADLDATPSVLQHHLSEALSYRAIDALLKELTSTGRLR